MQTYRKLRSLLLLARSIRAKLRPDVVQVAQVEFQDGSFPEEFVEIIEGKREVPSAEQLQEMRPIPHGALDSVLILSYCRNRLNESLMQEYSGFCLTVDLEPET